MLKILKKQNIVRQLSSCINKKYNGFHVILIKYSKKLRKKFKPIDIIYKPVKSPEKKIQCFYSQDISKSYRNFGETARNYRMGLSLSVIIVESFLQELTNKKDTLKINLVFL